MDQPVQLPNSFRFPGYDKRMYFIHRPGGGWQLSPHLDPKIAVVQLHQLTPPIRNDYLTFHRILDNKKNIPRPKTAEQEILQIRDEHIRLIEAMRTDPWLPMYHRGRVPALNELDGVMINVTKCLHWSPMQICRYRDLCRHERLAVQGVVHMARIGKGERERYMMDLALVFPEEWGQQRKDGSENQKGRSWRDDEQRYKDEVLGLKQISESSVEYFFPGSTSGEGSMTALGTDENRNDGFVPPKQPCHGPITIEGFEHNTLSASQHSQTKASPETPGRARKAVQIRIPESPQTPTPSYR